MATIDDKVVAMSFESSKFESGVNKTISSLDRLKAALHFPNAGKGLDDINAASKRVDLGHISRGVDGVIKALESMRLIAIGVMAQLATQAIRAGATFVKSFTLDPIKAGFSEYTTNLNAVQTILANTQAAGVKLEDVNEALATLNEYSDKTIYNFSQMARNIGTFTAAGVELNTATEAIKGIANLAALSGSNSEQASTAMYQLSQAISAGSVKLQDWNSVVNAGMGGTVFQRALAQTAEQVGTLDEGAIKLTGSMKNVSINGEAFRNSLSVPGKDSWLTSEVLTKTLSQFTGDLKDAELAAMGFNDAQIKAIQKTAQTAMHAATEVKTIAQVFEVAKETAASGWAATFQIVFGTFTEAKKTFTELSTTINGFINASADARNKVLADWKALGGRTVLIEGIKNAFHALGAILTPIKEAFRDIFPAATGKDLYDLTVRFRDFTETLTPSKETLDNLKSTFRGVFAVLDIGKQVVQGIFTMFGKMFGALSGGSGGFLNLTARIGEWLVKLDEALKKGDSINKFFEGLGDILAKPIEMLGKLADALGDLFGGFSSGGFSGQMDKMTSAMTPFEKVLNAVATAWDKLMTALSESGIMEKALDGIIKLIQGIGPAIGNAAANMNFEAIFAVIRTGLFAGLVLMFKNFFGKGSFLEQISTGFGKGIIGNISGAFGALEGSMKAMQTNIKAKTLKEIAIAIALLTASVVALSFVDPDKLKSSLTAITVMFGQLLGAMAVLDKIAVSKGFLKLPAIAAGLILLAGAIDILAIAVIALSFLSWEELLKGLSGVGALLVGLVAATKPLAANSKGMITAGVGITAMAVGLNIMALAVRQMAALSWEELVKGLSGVAGALVTLTKAMAKMPVKGMVAQGAGLILIAGALNLIAIAMKQLAGISVLGIAKGLVAIGGSLIIIVGAMKLMQINPKVAAGLVLVSFALTQIAKAVSTMGGMSIKQVATGLITLAGALGILAGAMYLMSGTLAGAAALGVAAVGISLLATALVKLGGMSPREIITSLVSLAAAFTVIGVAAALLTPTIPSLLGFGAALILIGAGLALAGAGVFLIGAGLSAIAVAGSAAVGVLVAALIELEQGLIETAKNLALGLLEIAEAFAAVAPKFVDALVKILDSLLDVVIQATPKIVQAFQVLLDGALKILHDNQPKIIQAGFDLIVALLKGIRNNLPQLVTLVVDIIVKFLTTLASNLNRIIDAGDELLVAFLKGIVRHISNIAKAAVEIIVAFITAVGKGYKDILEAGVEVLVKFLDGLAKNIKDVIAAGSELIANVVKGIGQAAEDIVRAARETAGSFINTLATEIVKLADEVFNAMITLLNGLATVIDNRAPEMRAAGVRLGLAIINGLTSGVTSAAGDLYNKITSVMDHAMSLVKKIPLIGSPSKVTTDIGKNIILGLVKGIDETAPKAYKSAEVMSNGLIKSFKDIFKVKSPSEVMIEIGKAVGEGFAVGLKGSAEDINSAFRDMNELLKESMITAKKTIAEEQAKLKELLKADERDAEAIKESQKILAENEEILKRSTAGHEFMINVLKKQKDELADLANEYDRVSEKLDKAKSVLDDIKQTRADIVASTKAQYATQPELDTTTIEEIATAKKDIAEAKADMNELLAAEEKDTEAISNAQLAVAEAQDRMAKLMEGKTLDSAGNSVDQLATYEEALLHQTKAIGAYNYTLQQLRKLGLDDATYQKLVDDGIADQAFATQLLSGGRKAVEKLNVLEARLQRVSKKLGTNVGTELFASGQKAAQGIVDGLEDKKETVSKKMKEIGLEMIASLKKVLGQKSPSREMMEIGKLSMEGLALGFTNNTKMVTDATDVVAKDALTAMQKSMRDISGAVFDELDANPVITPILDLTTIRNQSRELANMIPATASYGQASLISAQQYVALGDETAAIPNAPSVKFEQNNYSPEALTEIEIYRQTRNQLSQLKSVLALT